MDTAALPLDSDSLTATLPCPSLGMDHIIKLGPGKNPVFLPAVIRDLYLAGNTVDSLCHDLHDLFHQRSPSLESAWVQFYSTHALLIDLAHHALLPALALMHNAEHFSDPLNATALASTYADILAKLDLTKTLWSRLVDGNPHCSSCHSTTPPHTPAAVGSSEDPQSRSKPSLPTYEEQQVIIKHELHATDILEPTPTIPEPKNIEATMKYEEPFGVSGTNASRPAALAAASGKREPCKSAIPEPANKSLKTSSKSYGYMACGESGPSMHELHGHISTPARYRPGYNYPNNVLTEPSGFTKGGIPCGAAGARSSLRDYQTVFGVHKMKSRKTM
ncbi:hypothetical protein B0H21DRAFT_713146 [Amylocystis lapponica]|nr:hypothetical protein B0H21DRAFT_713146 [Amylocystis lapponica]